MIKVALTGSRYSGKDSVAKAFRQIGVPVFDADTVLKFIINFDIAVNKDILDNYGKYIFTGPGATIDKGAIKSKEDFDRLIDFAEYSLNCAYERFREENRESIYTIFHSSILFERGWNESMDYTISVFAPSAICAERAERAEKSSRAKVDSLMSSEMDPLQKTQLADFVIHNYESASAAFGDSVMQICKIDQKIVDKFLDQKEWLKVHD
jgi:dephospho-CoA kinase